MDAIEQVTKHGYTLTISCDELAESPREWDNIGVLYIPRPPRGCDFSDKNANREDALKAAVSIPVYILDHSGIAISSRPFGDKWDSWLAGCYYVTKETLEREYGTAPDARKRARECAEAELETFAEYIAGEVYFYTIENANGGLVDSCGGYYGDSGIRDIKETFEDLVKARFEEENALFVFAGINPETLLAI